MGIPILQLLPTPYALDVVDYANAYSDQNPSGDYLQANRLAQLVDPVPGLTAAYSISGESIERNFGLIVQGAQASEIGTIADDLIEAAQKNYSQAALQDLDGIPGTWRAVNAVPQDWTDPEVTGWAAAQVDTRTSRITGLPSQFRTIGTARALLPWTVTAQGRQPGPAPADPCISIHLLEVNVQRPWLDPTIFSTPGWALPGVGAGYLSSGSIDDNDGILPLITAGFLVGRTPPGLAASMTGQPSSPAVDFVGPIPTSPADADGRLYLIGVISELVPEAPPDTR